MTCFAKEITVESTTQIEFINITSQVEEVLDESGYKNGLVVVYSPHTTMGIMINHDESMLLQDFMRTLYRLVPVDDHYSHDLFELRRDKNIDGRSNGHSHCKAMLVGVSESIPFISGEMVLSNIQDIFAVEFDGARSRTLIVQVIGD